MKRTADLTVIDGVGLEDVVERALAGALALAEVNMGGVGAA